MTSAFFGINVALRALMAQQLAIDVTNHNIANANTEGYSRQDVHMVASTPFPLPSLSRLLTPGQLGTGVEIDQIRRLRDGFLDLQIRNELLKQGYWTVAQEIVRKVEVVFGEPSENALSSQLDQFWGAWQQLSSDPQNQAVRAYVAERGASLAATFNHLAAQLESVRADINYDLRVRVDQLNSLANRIAALNLQISKVEVTGDRANDLRDQRDLLLDELSGLVKISYQETPNGFVDVFVDGRALVSGEKANQLVAQADAAGNVYLAWASDGRLVDPGGGEVKANLDYRDGFLADQRNALDSLAQAVIAEVNSRHQAGYGLNNATGIDFFSGTGAANMSLSASIQMDLNNIAASGQPNAPGDNSIALNIARLARDVVSIGGQSTSVGSYYRSLITALGVKGQEAQNMVTSEESILAHLRKQKDAVSGVSLDEEAANLIKFQHAYNAAARALTVFDELLDRLISGTGVVGR